MATKGERTRQRLIDVAMARFEADGFAKTTMRTIAGDAGVSVGLAYRYFDAKESIVLGFYQQVAEELAEQPIDGTTLGARFRSVMQSKLALLAPRRRAMGSLLGAMLDPDSAVGVLSPATQSVRNHTRQALRRAVEGAEGLPPEAVEPLVSIAWLGHALLVLAWVQRPQAGLALVDRVAGALDLMAPMLWTPMASSALAVVAEALAGFQGVEIVTATDASTS